MGHWTHEAGFQGKVEMAIAEEDDSKIVPLTALVGVWSLLAFAFDNSP